jgi:hypothetical protein
MILPLAWSGPMPFPGAAFVPVFGLRKIGR